MAIKNLSDLASRATLLTTDRIAAWPTGSDVPERATLEALITLIAADRTIAQSAVAVPLTGSTTETTLATVTIPANAMGSNGRVGLVFGLTATSNANSKTLRVRYSGAAGTVLYPITVTTQGAHKGALDLMNRNSTSSQIANSYLGQGGWGSGTTAGTFVATAVNTTAATTLVLTGQLGVGTDTMTLEYYFADVFKKA